MKRTQEIIGLPIISISDGMEVGKVKSVIINADKGAIDYIVVESGIQILSARVIPTDRILGIGEYALTIENDGSINDLSKIPAAIDLLQKNILVKGTKVLTKKGRLIGEIGDIYVEEDERCRIIGLEYIADITQKRIRIIPRDSVITFGKNLVVVAEDVENKLLDTAAQLGGEEKPVWDEKKNLTEFELNDLTEREEPQNEIEEAFGAADEGPVAVADEYIEGKVEQILEQPGDFIVPDDIASEIPVDFVLNDSPVEEIVEEMPDMPSEPVYEDEPVIESIAEIEITSTGEAQEFFIEEQPIAVEEPEVEEFVTAQEPEKIISAPVESSSAASLFEQKQRQYLSGRRATKTIADNSGNLIISEGEVISDEIIDNAKQKGKLIELVMNNKA